MTKLIDILRNLLTAPKDVVEFELLAEQKISEIENMLDEATYAKIYGRDNLKAAKKLAQDWIVDWKKLYKDEPFSEDLRINNGKLYYYINTNFVEKNLTSWPELGFKVYGNKYRLKYGKDNL